MIGHGIWRSGCRTTCGAGSGSCDVPQSFIKGKCVQGKGTSPTRGPTQPALLSTQWRACIPDEGFHFHGWQQEWVRLLSITHGKVQLAAVVEEPKLLAEQAGDEVGSRILPLDKADQSSAQCCTQVRSPVISQQL